MPPEGLTSPGCKRPLLVVVARPSTLPPIEPPDLPPDGFTSPGCPRLLLLVVASPIEPSDGSTDGFTSLGCPPTLSMVMLKVIVILIISVDSGVIVPFSVANDGRFKFGVFATAGFGKDEF